MRDPNYPAPPEALWMRPDIGPAPRPDGSLVATLGTEFNTESGDLFDRILVALARLEAPSTVAVGNDLDPARFGALPPYVDIERHVDFDASIPRASAVLHHGGSGLFLRCVLGGAPQLVFPMGADQPFTADRITRLGIGSVLDPVTAAPADISDAVAELQKDSVIRERVLNLRESVTRLPAPSSVVSQLVAAIA
jgi:UDP:flavonoid glycosyltransferase YjiC (YdhE family)